jgi:hypothetical protein
MHSHSKDLDFTTGFEILQSLVHGRHSTAEQSEGVGCNLVAHLIQLCSCSGDGGGGWGGGGRGRGGQQDGRGTCEGRWGEQQDSGSFCARQGDSVKEETADC